MSLCLAATGRAVALRVEPRPTSARLDATVFIPHASCRAALRPRQLAVAPFRAGAAGADLANPSHTDKVGTRAGRRGLRGARRAPGFAVQGDGQAYQARDSYVLTPATVPLAAGRRGAFAA